MIEKKTAEKHKVNIIESDNTLSEEKNELLNKIKSLLPGVVNSDDQLDIKALNDLINIANTTSNNQGYELTFAGKGIARALADEPTNKELKIEMKQSKNFDSTGNVIIRGDNIDALKVLYQNYHNKIKMIYIDPPYNTKSENFIYKDNFKESDEKLIEEFGLGEETVNFLDNVYGTRSHSGWLAFMYPRLRLARELLREDGVIFISIDDNEQANLKIMCDEIFGEENFLGCITVVSNLKGRSDDKYFATAHNYLLVFSKGLFDTLGIPLPEKYLDDYSETSEKGIKYRLQGLRKRGSSAKREDRPKMYYAFYVDTKTSEVSLKKDDQFTEEVYPKLSDGSDGRWRWGKDSVINRLIELQGKIVGSENRWDVFQIDFAETENGVKRITPKTIWTGSEFANETGTLEAKAILGNKVFDTPKPIGLINYLLEQSVKENDIILDFFAGSGTTAHAVMQLNAEDNGNRKFILVQWDEEITKDKPAFKFCKDNKLEPVISSICIERVNRAGKKILKEQKEKDGMFQQETPLDIGYKVFSLTDKTRVKFDSDDHLFKVEGNRSSHFDTLYNMLAATCKPLDTPVEEIKKGSIYKAGNEIYLLGNVTKKEIEQYKDLKVNIDAFADFDLQNYLNLGISDGDNVTVVY